MGALIAFLVGTALGVAGAYAYFDAWRVWMRDEAAKWEEEIAREVKELRAQVARLVGVEKPPSTCCEEFAARGYCKHDDPTARMHG